jgi:hypothetical protein
MSRHINSFFQLNTVAKRHKRRIQETRYKMSSEHHHLQEEEKTKEEAKEEEPCMTKVRVASLIVSTPKHLLWKIRCQTASQLENPNCNKNLVTANTAVTHLASSWSGKKSSSVSLISWILRSPTSRNGTKCTDTCRISSMALWARAIVSPCPDAFNKASGIFSLQRSTQASSLAF